MNTAEKEYEKEVENASMSNKQTLRITMISNNKTEIERVAYSIYDLAKKNDPSCKGPISSKNNNMKITTRRSPCGNGSNTYDRFTMIVRKKHIDVTATYDTFKEITSSVSSPDVFIHVVVIKA